jgi:hypothetical protein
MRAVEVSEGGEQAGAHGREVVGDSTELAVVASQALEETLQLTQVVDLRNDLGQRIHEPVPRGHH